MSFPTRPFGQSSGYNRAILPTRSSVIASVRFTGIPLFGQLFFGTIQASPSIRYLASHLDTDWRDTESRVATSQMVRLPETISFKSLILICIIEKQRYLGHMGRIDKGIDVPLFYPFLFLCCNRGDVNLIAAMVTLSISLPLAFQISFIYTRYC